VDHQTEMAHKQAEEAVKTRIQLNEEMEQLQLQIEKNERDWLKADEFTKEYKESQLFVEAVKSLRIDVSKSVKPGSSTTSVDSKINNKASPVIPQK
jgi:hypothetical protein